MSTKVYGGGYVVTTHNIARSPNSKSARAERAKKAKRRKRVIIGTVAVAGTAAAVVGGTVLLHKSYHAGLRATAAANLYGNPLGDVMGRQLAGKSVLSMRATNTAIRMNKATYRSLNRVVFQGSGLKTNFGGVSAAARRAASRKRRRVRGRFA